MAPWEVYCDSRTTPLFLKMTPGVLFFFFLFLSVLATPNFWESLCSTPSPVVLFRLFQMYPLKAETGLSFMRPSQYEMFLNRQLKLYCKLLTFILFCMGEIKFVFQLKKQTGQPCFGLLCVPYPQWIAWNALTQMCNRVLCSPKIFKVLPLFILQFHRHGTLPL